MKNNAEYLRSVMKKYGEAREKRRRTIKVITSAAVCLAVIASIPLLFNVLGVQIDLDETTSQSNTVSQLHESASRSPASFSPQLTVSNFGGLMDEVGGGNGNGNIDGTISEYDEDSSVSSEVSSEPESEIE